MGGLMFMVGITLAVAICVPAFYLNVQDETFLLKVRVFAGLGMALGFGAVGFIDDYIKVVKKRNLGLTAPRHRHGLPELRSVPPHDRLQEHGFRTAS